MTRFYDFSYVTMNVLLFAFSDLQFTGRENVPASGPLIIVSNHLNLIDPPTLGAVIPRKIVFMAKEELFHQPIMSTVVKSYGAFPVKRNKPDRQALTQAQRILAQGGVLGIFPEGRRSRQTGLQRAEAGIALIAARSQAPILPVAITGTEAISGLGWMLRRPPIRLNIGHPFHLPETAKRLDSAKLSATADYIMYRVAELLPLKYRGVYADEGVADLDGQQLASRAESK